MRDFVKLQDYFVNAKVPRAERDRVPLVVSGEDIVWVVGHRIDDRYKVTPQTKQTIRLEASWLD
jgi:tRNA(Ile)-lysidine synthase